MHGRKNLSVFNAENLAKLLSVCICFYMHVTEKSGICGKCSCLNFKRNLNMRKTDKLKILL